MPAPDELYPPSQYGWGWLLIAVGILALLAVAVWLLFALTAPKRRAPAPQTPEPLFVDVLTALRTDYLSRIDQIEAAYRSRNIDARRANLDLSRTVRSFVNEYSGLEAPVLALHDLEARGVHPSLIDAIRRHYYPSIFQRGPAVDPVAGAEAARTVVNAWH